MSTRKLYNVRLQYARWQELPSEIQAWFAGLMGSQKERGRAFYELYFYWYNIAHELGHVLRAHYGMSAIETAPWDEEIAVNNFAVAYWQARNEGERLLRLGGWVREALATLEDPLPPGEERSTYFNTHYSELGTNPSAYGHYQFSMVLAALRQPIDLIHALRTLVMPEAKMGASVIQSPYLTVDSELPHRAVDDMREFLATYEVSLPEVQVVCSYSPMVQFVHWD